MVHLSMQCGVAPALFKGPLLSVAHTVSLYTINSSLIITVRGISRIT